MQRKHIPVLVALVVIPKLLAESFIPFQECECHEDLNNPIEGEVIQLEQIPFVCCDFRSSNKINDGTFDYLKKNAKIEEFIIYGKEFNLWLLLKRYSILTLHLYEYESSPKVKSCTNLITLEQLFIHNSKMMSASLTDIVFNSPKLETLFIDELTQLSDLTPEVIQTGFHLFDQPFKSTNIRSVSFTRCQIYSLAGVDFLKEASELQMLSLSHNKLTCLDNPNFFPKEANKFYYLDISNNKLEKLPLDWEMPQSIRILYLNNNKFIEFSSLPLANVWPKLREFWMNDFNCTKLDDRFKYLLKKYLLPLCLGWECCNFSKYNAGTILLVVNMSSKRVSSNPNQSHSQWTWNSSWFYFTLTALFVTGVCLMVEFIMSAISGTDVFLCFANCWMLLIILADLYYMYYNNNKIAVFVYSIIILSLLMIIINLRINIHAPFLFMPIQNVILLSISIIIILVHFFKIYLSGNFS